MSSQRENIVGMRKKIESQASHIVKLEQRICELRTQAQPADALADALKELLECPFNVDAATVPRAGIEAAPEQVMLEVSVDLLRWRKAREALTSYCAAQEKK